MHRIAYETIIENDRKNWNEPLEFTINAINDRQYIDLYNSYITFKLWVEIVKPIDILVLYAAARTTQAGFFEQADISNLIYFEGDTIKNAVFDSIRDAPDYRSMITYLFTNRFELEDMENNNDIKVLEDNRIEPRPLCKEEVYFTRDSTNEIIYFSDIIKIPCRHLFELANEPNIIHYKEMTMNLRLKNPYRFLLDSNNYMSTPLDVRAHHIVSMGYSNLTLVYHYYQDLDIEQPLTLRNTPLQAFTFSLDNSSIDNRIKKSILMNDVYRYLMIYCTRKNESSRLSYELPLKITLAQQGRAFWSFDAPPVFNDPDEIGKQRLWDLTSYCINKPGQPANRIKWSTHSWTYYIYVLPIDELIDYEAPGYLDFDITLHNEADAFKPVSRQLHLVFFGK